jgi:hypothetical protein
MAGSGPAMTVLERCGIFIDRGAAPRLLDNIAAAVTIF